MVSLADSLKEPFSLEEISYISDHAAALGIQFKSVSLDSYSVAPISIIPCYYNQSDVQAITEVQRIINVMVDKIARNPTWLHKLIEPIAEADDFTRRLLEISKTVHREGIKQQKYLGILRSDYMMDTATGKPLQVEINTISAGLGVLSTKTRSLHQLILERFAHKFEVAPSSDKLAEVTAWQGVVNFLAAGFKAYGGTGYILILVEENERNIFDQLPLSLELFRL
mmetsp:Transcript_11402/g.22377  ORF Transcript_11402/g.22377 Transcript_11402/m.22377 type:complete len:225 (+) Transcript_11402:40-714(+)